MENVPQTNQFSNQPAVNSTGGSHWRNLLTLLAGGVLIIGFDQYTKWLVVRHIPFLESWLPPSLEQFLPYFRIVNWHNSGAAFGVFQNGNLIFTVLAILASVFIIAFFPVIDKKELGLRAAMIFQLGGALGNLIDRFKFGYVIDFISLGKAPVFNVADASISIGVAILLLDVLLTEWRAGKNARGPQTGSNSQPSEGFEG